MRLATLSFVGLFRENEPSGRRRTSGAPRAVDGSAREQSTDSVAFGHLRHGSVLGQEVRARRRNAVDQQTSGTLFASVGGPDGDSDDDCEYFDLEEPETKRQVAMSRHDTNCLVAEWVLLVQTLASLHVQHVDRALARPTGREGNEGAKRRVLGQGCEELSKTVLELKLEGGATELADVLELLTRDRSKLGQHFHQARTAIHEAFACGAKKQSIKVVVRLVVVSASAATHSGIAKLEKLATALREYSQCAYHCDQNGTSGVVLDAVDVFVTDHETLMWLASKFPTEIRVGNLEWKGDQVKTDEFPKAIGRLLHGDGANESVPMIETVRPRCQDTNTLVALLSATRTSQSLRAIELSAVLQAYGRDPEERARRWRWFAYALFSKRARHRLHHAVVNEWALLPEDVSTVVEVLRSNTPERLLSLPGVLDDHSTGKLTVSSLDLSFGGVQHPMAAPLEQLIRALASPLPHLSSLKISVSDDPAISDTCAIAVVDSFAATLQELNLHNIELDSLGSLFVSPTGSSLSLQSLTLKKLFVGDMGTCKAALLDLLGDPMTRIGKRIETIKLHLSERHSVEVVRQFISYVKQMLENNLLITRCEVVLEGNYGAAREQLAKKLDSVNGQVVTSPVRLSCRLALLSIFENSESIQKRPRPTRHRLPRPHIDGLALIFEFAAATTNRIARVHTNLRVLDSPSVAITRIAT